MRLCLAVIAALTLISLAAAARGADPPYYFKQSTTPVFTTALQFDGMTGQGTCTIVIAAQGGSPTTINSASILAGQAATPSNIQFYDQNGTGLGTTFTTNGQKAAWFPCANANGVLFSVTTAGGYNYTFTATSFAWPYGSVVNGGGGGGASPSPCPTSLVNGGCNVNQLNGDEARANGMQVATVAINTASTNFLLVAGSTTQARIAWGSWIGGNTAAGASATLRIGQQNVSACDTNCVTWTGTVPLSSTAGNYVCMLGPPVPAGAWGTCKDGVGIPLPATNPATNLYVTTGTTAPVGATAFAYWTNPF